MSQNVNKFYFYYFIIKTLNVPILAYRIGELPKYLKEIKQEKEDKEREAELIDPQCPPGHVALTDEERLDSLEMAKKSTFLILFKRIQDKRK